MSKVVKAAKGEGIELNQTYAKESNVLGYRVGHYEHARLFKRMLKVIGDASSFSGNPYDGHMMHEQIKQSAILNPCMGVKLLWYQPT